MIRTSFIYLCSLIFLCGCQQKKNEMLPTEPDQQYHQAISLMGDTLYAAAPSEKLQQQYIEKQKAYLADSTSLDKLIWYGRFTAYTGDYKGAVDIYTQGLKQFPDQTRLLRHRGHRYISLREFDKAIADLSKAAELIEDQQNTIEEDGMPNAQGIPLTTKHGNIYYHLGLAHYLKGDYLASLESYKKCLALSKNTDGLASATHWIVLSLKTLEQEDKINTYLDPIATDLVVIENGSYLNSCSFYKGLKPIEQLYDAQAEVSSSNSALKYGLARWLWLNDSQQLAMEIYADILDGNDWASFGYIAAEADLARNQ